jgi:hypothetical protein
MRIKPKLIHPVVTGQPPPHKLGGHRDARRQLIGRLSPATGAPAAMLINLGHHRGQLIGRRPPIRLRQQRRVPASRVRSLHSPPLIRGSS